MSAWYLDDGSIAGDLRTVGAVFSVIQKEAAKIGLTVNQAKCHLWLPAGVTAGTSLPEELRSVTIHGPEEGLRVLGTPIGHPSWVKSWVDDFIKGLTNTLGRLKQLGSPRAASHILRSCLGSAKVMFLLRTLSWEPGVQLGSASSKLLKSAWESVLGCPLTDAAWALACIPIEQGGLGVLDPLKAQPIAFLATAISAIRSQYTPHMTSLPPGSLEAAVRTQSWCPTLAKDLVAILSGPHSIDTVVKHQQAAHWAKQSDWGLELKTTCGTKRGEKKTAPSTAQKN